VNNNHSEHININNNNQTLMINAFFLLQNSNNTTRRINNNNTINVGVLSPHCRAQRPPTVGRALLTVTHIHLEHSTGQAVMMTLG